MSDKKTVLYENHDKRGAKFIPFGGYQLPAWYSNLKEEHLAVRNAAGAFDISHMGVMKLTGEGAFELLQKVCSNDMNKTEKGLTYSMILKEDGTVLDDIMVGQLDGEFVLIANASNKDKILSWLNQHNTTGVAIDTWFDSHSFLAIQGPKAAETLSKVFDQDLTSPGRFALFGASLFGQDVIWMRSGYTGEDGYEIAVPNEIANQVWDAIIDKGEVTPCGLGSRDALRIEAGLPLYGQELSEEITPLMTRYPWVLGWGTGFIGEDVLAEAKEKEREWVTVGVQMDTKMIARTDYPVVEGGRVTSGTLSPYLNVPIAMAMVKPEYKALGSKITIEVRGKECAATVVKVPFFSKD